MSEKSRRVRAKRLIIAGIIIAILMIAAIFVWHTQVRVGESKDPPVITGYPGTIQMATVHIRSSQSTAASALQITGDIGSMITLPHIDGATLSANEDTAVPLIVTIPGNKAEGTYKGSAEVRQNNKTLTSVSVAVVVKKPSATDIPTTTSEATDDRITTPDGAIPVVKDELLVGLALNINNASQRIKEIAAQTQAVIVGALPDDHTFQLRYNVANLDELDKKRKDLAWQIGVQFVGFNPLIQDLTIPNDMSETAWNDTQKDQRTWGQRYIGLPKAWDTTTGNKSLRIGVIDNNFDYSHPDLKNNILPNVGVGGDPISKIFARSPLKSPHGTYVAGTTCAEGNNGIGISGVMWHCALGLYDFNSRGVTGHFEIADAQKMMIQAAKDDMRVVNMSNGTGSSDSLCKDGKPVPLNPFMQAFVGSHNDSAKFAIDWAIQQKKDVLWVFAAGNSCRDVVEVAPAALAHAYPNNIINVAAINESEDMSPGNVATRLTQSNYGADVSVAAPGQYIYTTNMKELLSSSDKDYYKSVTGTSIAAPMVAGLAGLVLSAHNDFTAKQVKQCIVDAANSAGHKVNGYAFNVINAPKALDCQPDPDPKSPLGHTQQCVFNMTLLPTQCASTNPTVRVKFTNVAGSAACVNESHLDWGDHQQAQVDTLREINVNQTIPLSTHTFKQPGKYTIIDGLVPKTGGPCLILEQGYDFTLLTGNEQGENPF